MPEKLAEPLGWKKPCRVFVNSMSDLFHEELSNEDIAAVFGVMAAAPRHTFQVLTKRAERMQEWFDWARGAFTDQQRGIASAPNTARAMLDAALEYAGVAWKPRLDVAWRALEGDAWPLPNVWLGVSVEDQQRAEERIPHLLATPAAVRFLSVEPQLGPVDLARYLNPVLVTTDGRRLQRPRDTAIIPHMGGSWEFSDIHQVIWGGESGPGARAFDVAWGRSIVEQCTAAGVKCFSKQFGARPVDGSGLMQLRDRKGGDPAEWPPGDWPRQFPEAR